jgi:hypothetical protein
MYRRAERFLPGGTGPPSNYFHAAGTLDRQMTRGADVVIRGHCMTNQ